MTYDSTAARTPGQDWNNWARTPGFHPGKLLAVIAGFAIFPPLGVAALVYFIWSGRRASLAGPDGRANFGGCGMHGCHLGLAQPGPGSALLFSAGVGPHGLDHYHHHFAPACHS